MHKRKVENPIYLLMLFLGFFNLLGRGSYILLIALLMWVILKRQLSLPKTGLVAYGAIWAICDIIWIIATYGLFSVKNLLIPITGFLALWAGYSFYTDEDSKQNVIKTYGLLALAAAFYGVCNMISNIPMLRSGMENYRILNDIWKTEDTLATGQYALFVPVIGGLYYFLTKTKKELHWLRLAYILTSVVGIAYTIMSASRFILYSTVVECVLFMLTDALLTKNYKAVRNILIVVGVAVLLYQKGSLGIRAFWENSALAHRLEALQRAEVDSAFSSVSRSNEVKSVLQDFPLYIHGGCPTGLPFVHNTWLSVLNSSGLLVALPFFALTVFALVRMIRIALTNDNPICYLILGFLVVFYCYFYIEPMFEGAKWLFYFYMFSLGLFDGFYCNYQKLIRKKEDGT